MAECCDDLQALAAARENLFELCLKLRSAELAASPAQMLDAHNLLLGLRLAGCLPTDRSAWRPYLAPIFCRSEQDQRVFGQVFEQWLAEERKRLAKRGAAWESGEAKADDEHKQLKRRPGRYAALALMLSIIAAGVAWRAMQPPVQPNQPDVGVTEQPNGTVVSPPSLAKPKSTAESLPTRPPEIIQPETSFGWTATDLRNAAATGPALLLVLWLLWSVIDRRIVLTRRAGSAPSRPHTRWVHGVDQALFDAADLRQAAGRLRAALAVPSRRIDPRRTVDVTVRQGGLFSPVYRARRRHPEYLVLIDRAGLPLIGAQSGAIPRDHLAALGETLVEQLRAEQVIVHVYYFDRDPRYCQPAEERACSALDLPALAARHGAQRLMLLGDAAGLFEPLSGRSAAWLEEFQSWPQRFVLTPRPVAEWGYSEASLALAGFAVAPLDSRSLVLLARDWLPLALRDDLSETALRQARLLAPLQTETVKLPELLQQYGERWLEARPPQPGSRNKLLAQLRDYLGEDGWVLLQALAAYPELTWPLSLYIDWRLFPQPSLAARAQRLLKLARLPWLRHGRMPDYLRLALVRGLPRRRHKETVGYYQALLAAAQAQGSHAIELHIGPPPPADFKARLRAWLGREDGFHGDRIFAKVLLGGRPSWLDVELPQALARLLPGTAWGEFSARLCIGLLAVLLWGGGVFAGFEHYRQAIDDRLLAAELARNAQVSVALVVMPGADWLAAPLRTALDGIGLTRQSDSGVGERLPVPLWNKTHLVQYGAQAKFAARRIVQRLRWLGYGEKVALHEGDVALLPDPKAAEPGAASTDTAAVADHAVTVWLADAPRVFQDRLAPPVQHEPEMVILPTGRFTMGSPGAEAGRYKDEGPQHAVVIAQSFAMGRYEVTFEEYDEFARDTQRELPKDYGWGRDRRPVVGVSWNDAKAYAAWLAQKTGKAYRLPSEAEWEYAARAGTTTARYWGEEIGRNQANCAGCGSAWDNKQTAPVGSFAANPFGLHDMLGNVWEWVEDCYHNDYTGAPADGTAWTRGDCGARVLRGGSWYDSPFSVRAANRFWFDPAFRNFNLGFRLARTLN